MTATPDPSSPEAARLRLAQELLDERPSPGVRAAVLRAAAEAAAGDRAASTAPAPRPRTARRWFEWGPMATIGATAVALLAVGVALHVDREASNESPSRFAAPAAPSPAQAPAAPSSPTEAAPPPAPVPPKAAPAAASDGLRESTLGGKAPSVPLSNVAAPAPVPSAKSRAIATESAAVPARDQGEEAKPRDELSDEPRPQMQAPAMGTIAPQAAPPMAPAAEGRPSTGAPTTRMKAAKEALQPLLAPDEWLRRIVELRRAGRNAEADQELTRFRAAYPNTNVPADALK
jgi:hypothetical protein